MVTPAPLALLARLEATRFAYGPGRSERKLALLHQLGQVRLSTAAQVLRLHEHLCFMRANPDNADVLREAERLLAGFARRKDLLSHREQLADSGLAGTDIRYRFFWPTARWLVARWSDQLSIEWDELEDPALLSAALPLLVTLVEASWLRSQKPSPEKALARLADRETDAAFWVRAVESMPGNDFTREALYDSIGLSLILKAGRDTPSRTHAHYPQVKVHFRTSPPTEGRPDLWAEIERPPRSVRPVSRQQGSSLIDLAREAMVTRGRDLDAFAYGDPGDVRLIEDGNGLAWAMIGLLPERRPILRTAYGYLTLRNGVPIGYVQSDTLWRCVDLAFNTFPTYRGRETAVVLGRTMAMLHHLFDATSFTLEPYQLGDKNDEGIASGAWWFYYKLGFRPRNQRIRTVVRAELERMKRNPDHRSTAATLAELARDYLYLDRPGLRAPYWPRLAALGLKVASHLSQQRADQGETAATPHPLAQDAAGALSQSSPAQRSSWAAWAPIVELLPGLDQWNDEEKRDLVEVSLAKGGRRDTDYLRLFNSHQRLGEALRRLTRA